MLCGSGWKIGQHDHFQVWDSFLEEFLDIENGQAWKKTLPIVQENRCIQSHRWKTSSTTYCTKQTIDSLRLFSVTTEVQERVLNLNLGRYDNVLVSQYAYQIPKLSIKMVSRGNKIFQKILRMGRGTIKITKTQFHDTFNLLPVSVSKMVKALGLKDLNGEPLKSKGVLVRLLIHF